jgi:alpha,alpha-trehalose phosphorylase
MRFKPKVTNAFGLDPWILLDEGFKYEQSPHWHREAVFSQGNGQIGMRGNLDEPLDDNAWRGIYACFLNGCYEYEDLAWAWRRYGLAEKSQCMMRIPDWHIIRLTVGGEPFSMLTGQVRASRRELDMRTGILTRQVEWQSPQGRTIRIATERLISVDRLDLAVIRYRVTAIGGDCPVTLATGFDGDVEYLFGGKHFLAASAADITDGLHYLELHTQRSQQTIGLAAAVSGCEGFTRQDTTTESRVDTQFSGTLHSGQTATLTKYAAILLERAQPAAGLRDRARRAAGAAASVGLDKLRADHCAIWSDFWQDADITIEGDPAIQQGVHYAMFQLVQSAGKDGLTNVGAKGLTGYLYAGKTFWDTEVYMVPFFANARPAWARALLDYRYHTLDKARAYAKSLHFAGALYPWETINGEESAFIYEASTAQYHINAAVGYAIERYYEATGDWEYLGTRGLEMLIETSRMFYSLGAFIPQRGNQFCLCEVCGPDEYSPMVDNNCYTNTMVKHQFLFTCETAQRLERESPAAWATLQARLALGDEEMANWRRAADAMYIPYATDLAIHLQDDQFRYRPPIGDIEQWKAASGYAEGKIHPLNLFRAQVLKQADVILLMVLRSLDYDTAQKRRNYDYYEPKTLHSSSLSPCMYSITASELGRADHALPYLFYTVRLDLDNYGGSEMGLHTAALGGAWRGIVQGLGGLAFHNGRIDIAPRLPQGWRRLCFNFRYQGSQARLDIEPSQARVTLLDGPGFAFSSGLGQAHVQEFHVDAKTPSATLPVSVIALAPGT